MSAVISCFVCCLSNNIKSEIQQDNREQRRQAKWKSRIPIQLKVTKGLLNKTQSVWILHDRWAVSQSVTVLCNKLTQPSGFITQSSGMNDKCWGVNLLSWGERGSFNNSCLCKHIKQTERQTDRLTSSSRRTTSVFPQRAAWCSAVPDSDCLLISIPAWISNLMKKKTPNLYLNSIVHKMT